MITIERATRSDLPDVLALLRANSLPTEGVAEHVDTFFVARRHGKVLGTAGLEWYDDGALLRSVAVDVSARGAGLGQELTRAALEAAEDRGSGAVFLLTTTADRFFSTDPRQPISTLTVQVFTYATSPYKDWHRQAWAGALVLVTIVLACSLVARFATARLERIQRGA